MLVLKVREVFWSRSREGVMSSLRTSCHECGMPVTIGSANCSHCGAAVGTVFDESTLPAPTDRTQRRKLTTSSADQYSRIQKAKERANNSVILALASFFCPGIGFLLGVTALIMAGLAVRTLTIEKVEEGRGSAIAGLIIGVLGLIAQGAYAVYIMKSGRLPFVE
jgi:uncharacterized Zn finger protein (UPF0148 family)